MPRKPYALRLSALLLLAVVAPPQCGAQADGTRAAPSSISLGRHGHWWVALSENFQVCSLTGAGEACAAARCCEQLRLLLARRLGFSYAGAPWNPKCQVILYPTLRSYVAAVGPGSEATLGSSLVEPPRGAIRTRRIDLRTDVGDYFAALPHELCHLLVADHYRQEPAPLWYDEGLALLFDPAAKRALHERDLRDGIRRGQTFPVGEILAATSYPSPDQMGVFYGQCASLLHYLWQRGEPAQLHEFVAQSREVGPDLALRSIYGFTGRVELERRWLRNGQALVLAHWTDDLVEASSPLNGLKSVN